MSKICQNHQNLGEWQKLASKLTEIVHKSSSFRDSIKCRRRFKLFVDLLDSLEQGRTSNWILMTPVLALANSAWVYWLCWLYCVVEITLLNTSELYCLDELYDNELVFVLSFVSSNNTDVETTEQFILLYTRYVCDFSGLTNLPETLKNRRKHLSLYRTLLSWRCRVFLLLTQARWILLMLSTERSFASRLFTYSKG